MKKIATLALSLALLFTMCLQLLPLGVAAEDTITVAETLWRTGSYVLPEGQEEPVYEGPELTDVAGVIASNQWKITNRWSFADNMVDDIGGVETVIVEASAMRPKFKDGKIQLAGYTAYTFADPIMFGAEDNFKVVVKGTIEMSNAYGIASKRLLGSSMGNKNSGIYFTNLGIGGEESDGYKVFGANYGLSSISWMGDTTNAYGHILHPDLETFDFAEEHVYEFVHYNSYFYLVVDGVLVAANPRANASAFVFTDLFGCSWSATANLVGVLDYLYFAELTDAPVENPPEVQPTTEPVTEPPVVTTTEEPEPTEPADNTTKGDDEAPATTDDKDDKDDKDEFPLVPVLIAAAAVVVIVVVVVVVIKKKK